MARRHRQRKQSHALLGGFPPAHLVNPVNDPGLSHSSGGARQNRKALQLCQQVAETLSFVLAGDGEDELLAGLWVYSVTPAPNASRLLVTVATQAGGQADRSEILVRLNEQMGRLRFEVAASIHRKRTPTLVFAVAPTPNI